MSDKNLTLPSNYTPSHYEIELSDINLEKNSFVGNVKIDVRTNDGSNSVSLNMRDLELVSAMAEISDNEFVEIIGTETDIVNDVVVLKFPRVLEEAKFRLNIEYKGKIQTNMSGFYRSDYKDVISGETKSMLSTQFEATDARRAFPCFDAPDMKSTFDVCIVVDKKYTVLSNMPLKSHRDIVGCEQTVRRFHTTPLMSTYLVAWAVGEFDFIESETEKDIYPTLENYSTQDGSSSSSGKLPIRIYTAKGKANQGEFAMGVAKKVIDFFSESFEIPYPLPKLDLLCVEAYSHNAMENFSLITFRPSALLYDGDIATADTSALQKIAYVVSHEIAHQWFGNLVTMKWWDELWLNEGFATWVGYYAIERFFPSWNVPSMVMLHSHEVALELDALKESHPIKVAVRNAKDTDQVFDSISYLKGCSILEMLSGYLGQTVFLKGVALYLQRYKFSNATMIELFNCIAEVSNIEILPKIKDWILKIGYPLLIVRDSGDKIIISQKRFLSSGEPSENDKDTVWWIPLMTNDDAKAEFFEKEKEIPKSEFTHFNNNAYGFYRVKYDSDNLFQENLNNLSKLSSRGKMALISDTEVACTIKQLLALISEFCKNQNPSEFYVWSIIFERVKKMESLLSTLPDLSSKITEFINSLIAPSITEVIHYLENPYECLLEQDSENFLRMQFYDAAISMAGLGGQKLIVEKCRKLYNSGKYPVGLRNVVLNVVLGQADTSKALFNKAIVDLKYATLSHKEGLLVALGSVRNEELYPAVLNLLLTIEPMDVQFLADSLGNNAGIRPALWSFFKNNYEQLHERLSINSVVIDRFIRFSLKNLAGSEYIEEVKEFFKGKNLEGFDRGVRQTIERLEKNTKYVDNNAPLFKEYFKL